MNFPPRVLIADDNRDTVLTLAMLLRAEGYETRARPTTARMPCASRA
jgi:CheY-like chemotaxis protein